MLRRAFGGLVMRLSALVLVPLGVDVRKEPLMSQLTDGIARIKSANNRLRAIIPGWDIVNEIDLGVAMVETADVAGVPVFTDAVDGTVTMPDVQRYQTVDFTPQVDSDSPVTYGVVGIAGTAACPFDPQTGLMHFTGFAAGQMAVVISAKNEQGTAAARYVFNVTA